MIRNLSNKLKELRLTMGFSQAYVAKVLGVTPPLISAYEASSRAPSLETLVAMAQLYRCSTDYLLGLTDITDRKTLQPFTNEQAAALISFVNNNRAN